MSLDARYILRYDCHEYIPPTPMEKDRKYLEENFGGKCEQIGWEFDVFYDKPKHTLLPEQIAALHADQILEYTDCDKWRDVTGALPYQRAL